MAIARNPKRNQSLANENQVQAFISGAGQATVTAEPEQNKKPIMIRVDPSMIERIDRAAKRAYPSWSMTTQKLLTSSISL